MARIALLIGVSEYGTGIPWLPCATKDVTALQQLLEDKEIGKFDEVRTLLNPDTQTIAKTIEKLFREREKEDFVLLFFSGHGIQDDSGKLFFAAHNTQKTDGKVYLADTVSASFVHDQIEGSRCWQMVVILNCCFSGAFSSNLIPRSVGIADVNAQLGGRGRAILTSCNAVQFSFEEKDAALSIYSQYLIQGIKTGEADQDRDGQITVDELHHYIRKNVVRSKFPMSPEIHLTMEAPLTIAHTLMLDYTLVQNPSKFYEDKVALFAQHGKISKTCHKILDDLREALALSHKDAKTIESKVLKPQKKYKKNLHLYRQEFLTIARRSHQVTAHDRNLLVRLQQGLRLKAEDVALIEASVIQKVKDSRQWLNCLKWATLIPIIPFAITSSTAVGIYFQVYEKLPPSIQEPLSPLLEKSHHYLDKAVGDLRQQLAIQIMDSETTQIWTVEQMSQIQAAIDKAVTAEKLAEKAQSQTEWSKSATLWEEAIAEWKAASQLLEAVNRETQPPAFLQSLNRYFDIERQKAESELHFGAAVNKATTAMLQGKNAKTKGKWIESAHLWEQAHDHMQAVSPTSHYKKLAKARAATCAANQQEAQKWAESLSQPAVNK